MHIRLTLALSAALLLVASSTFAQSGAYTTTFSANFDVAYHELSDTSHAGAHFDLARTITDDIPRLAVVGEVGFNHFSDATVASVLGGARVRIPIADERFLPFAQLLLGLYHCSACGDNDFALQAGGGVDFLLPHRNNIRLRAELDYRHMFNSVTGFDAARLSGGVVFPLNVR
ncbi:MAG TPA: hypothetical protein VL309_09920 [Vicinamibacterales bacterium]|jgi:hypothetical protein|nr:hypothetical protein [Vicinamibacterales bacterium]